MDALRELVQAEAACAGTKAISRLRMHDILLWCRASGRLHVNEEDVVRKFNRTENVRVIPPSDPDFKALYARRNDAESINRSIDDSMWLSRAHSVGHARQHLNLIGYALMVNSLALLEQRQRAAPLAA